MRQALLLLLVSLLAACTDAFDAAACPSWIKDYETFHRKQRNKPGAKYLVAAPLSRDGLGDRLRGVLLGLRVAAATQRVLLCHWQHPGQLTDFFQPARGIDWRLAGTPAEPKQDHLLGEAARQHKDVRVVGTLQGRDFLAGLAAAAPSISQRFLVLRSNLPVNITCPGCPPVTSVAGPEVVCMFQFLFKPSTELQRRTQQQLQRLYPGRQQQEKNPSSSSSSSSSGGSSSSVQYAALHLRLGHVQGEQQDIIRVAGSSPLSLFTSGVDCALRLAAVAGIDTSVTPLLLVADSGHVRRFAQRGRLAQVVSPLYDALHIGKADEGDVERHFSTFVDMALLAGARCLVQSKSGFSRNAWFLGGGSNCTLFVTDCDDICSRDAGNKLCAGSHTAAASAPGD